MQRGGKEALRTLRNLPRSPSVEQTPADIEIYHLNTQIVDHSAVGDTGCSENLIQDYIQ
jgi:hypothetical protein